MAVVWFAMTVFGLSSSIWVSKGKPYLFKNKYELITSLTMEYGFPQGNVQISGDT